jgi:ribosomal protein S27AE
VTTALDGNALGGVLYEAYGAEMTTRTGVCGTCGASSMVAQLVVYLSAIGGVGRCPRCGSVLIVTIEHGDETHVDTRGLASLEMP